MTIRPTFLLTRLLLALLALAGFWAARPANAAGSIRITVSPNVLLADGISSATVTADVRLSNGRQARDGTEVRFYTTAGSITQAAFTSAGVARATLTSSAVPQAARISVSAGVDQAVISVPMVSKLVETSVGGRVLSVKGKYVAFSEDKRFIQADQQVRVKFRGLQLDANSVQLDLNANTLKALGNITIASDDQTKVGERLWLNLKSFEGYITAVGVRQWFSGYGLTDLPERPKNVDPEFELEDLTDSKLLWVSQQATYVVDERVQVQNARAYVGGIKSLRMPFHQSNLAGGFGETESYVGFGTQGFTVDLPLYVAMRPESSTAFHVGYGSRSGGVGYFTRRRGLSVDLVQKYGFSGASEGQASITDLAAPSRLGVSWNHTQQVNKNTRLVTDLQFPGHRDLYGNLNLTSGLPFGTIQAGVTGTKFQQSRFAKTLQLGFQSKPKPIADGKVAVSAETSFYSRDTQTYRVARGLNVPVQNAQYQTFGVKLRPATVTLREGLSLNTSTSLRAVTGDAFSGFGPTAEAQIQQQLPRNGFLSFGLNYNRLASVSSLVPTQGTLHATLNATLSLSTRFRVSALGSMALDAQSSNGLLQASYQLTPSWRLDATSALFRFGDLSSFDYQLGVARTFGNRELGLYWSRREHRLLFEFGASRF